jgi:hypothetical protein
MEALASGCFVVTSNWGYLPETTAGFAPLIPLSQSNTSNSIAPFSSISERESYAQEFLVAILEVLEVLTGANPQETEQFLRKQVDYFNKYCTWRVRALEWEEWLKTINKKSHKISVEASMIERWLCKNKAICGCCWRFKVCPCRLYRAICCLVRCRRLVYLGTFGCWD